MKLKSNILVALVVTVTNLFADISVSDVKVFSGYPWKEVAIGYTITGSTDQERTLDVTATDNTNGKTYVCWTLEGVSCTPGRHIIKWNALVDGVKIASNDVVFKLRIIPSPPLYCVIDLSGGKSAESYPVTGLTAVPNGGWTDEYKTTKLVLRRVEAGTFKMQNQYDVRLTRPFYIGVFELTHKQYDLVARYECYRYWRGDSGPVLSASSALLRRGDTTGYPPSNEIWNDSFLGRLRTKTGLDFDLPTEAQWEYACRAGTTSDYNNGGSVLADLNLLGRWSRNGGQHYVSGPGWGAWDDDGSGDVGKFLPNAWGLYDMHGNASEICLDWFGEICNATDPTGADSGSDRVIRGGSWYDMSEKCTSSWRDKIPDEGVHSTASEYYRKAGFRISWTPNDRTWTFQ